MKKLLSDPDFPVTDRFVSRMSVLALSEDAGGDMPAQRQKAEDELRHTLVAALPLKRGRIT